MITAMKPLRLVSAILFAGCAIAFGDEAATKPAATAAPTEASFVRFHEDEKGAQLQTGIATYRNAQGVSVDLIGAIHIADKAYYAGLNERFTHYDALLYELVGGPYEKRVQRLKAKRAAAENGAGASAANPTGESAVGAITEKTELEAEVKKIEAYMKNPRPSESLSPEEAQEEREEEQAGANLSWLKTLFETMQGSLQLEDQMSAVDYGRPNFVHADMSLKQFADMQAAHDEGFLALWVKAVKAQWDHPEAMPDKQPGVLQILEILARKDSPVELKRIVGRMFDSVETIMSGVEGPNGTVIIAERNKVALAVLEKQIAAGKKKLGIFYGAAHLKDMQKRLLALGFKLEKTEWLTAWDLPPEPKQ